MKNIFSKRWAMIGAGCFIGLLAILLQRAGNPANMGVCVACFTRDIAGAIGLHRADVVQYLRPEIIGFVLGAFAVSLMAREYRPRGGSAPLIRFFLGTFAAFGALVFLGCPWRAILGLAGGDWNAIIGMLGLIGGASIGVLFLKRGFTLGRAYNSNKAAGWVFPAVMLGLLLILVFRIRFGEPGPLYFSVKGPGSMHAPIWISLAAGLAIGIVAQRSRFCTVGAYRDIFLAKDFHLASGVLGMLATAFVLNLLFKSFHPGFQNQPVAHTAQLWNFAGMVLSGLAFVLAGGCPGRQLILSGEGDADAAVFVMGLLTGAALAHNFAIASTAKGASAFGPSAVVLGLVFCLIIGFSMREKVA